ncbi:uncharacterized protein LOC117617913 isoform X2 [Prunus dulcis]|uniref:uncharacterized protein LOC117617913 isoform X2 n=1 Tax=Prunus dulcis TaxID=3755 RepID=UPI0014828B2F|nr:uncharacterized protein LOC117617913 isoform X2 [Prunus dulcis]
MLSANDPVESFFNSIQLVKEALSPLELSFRKAAKDFEYCWAGPKNKVNAVDLVYQFDGVDKNCKAQIFGGKKKAGHCVTVGGDERKKGLSAKVPIKALFGKFSQNSGNENRPEVSKSGLTEKERAKEDGSCVNCLQFAVNWSVLANSFVQAFPGPFKFGKKRLQKTSEEDKACSCKKPKVSGDLKQRESKGQHARTIQNEVVSHNEGKHVSLECLIGFVFDQLTQNLQKFDHGVQESGRETCETSPEPTSSSQTDHFRVFTGLLEGRKADVNGFLGNLKFARVGGVPSGVVGVTSSVNEEGDEDVTARNRAESAGNSPQKLASDILSIPLSNVERLRSTLSTVSLTELIELVPHLGRPSKEYPDKKKLFSVQDFFRYTESEGRRFFEELDRDRDGQVTLEDLEIAIRKRKLPRRYAHEFMRRTRRHIFSKSFGWKQFLSLMEQKEPTILRAYTSLCLSKSGTLQKSEVLASLKNAGLPANEDNAVAMMRFLNADTEGSISYGHFRNFMLLLPSDRLQDDPRSIWFEAATVVAVAPPVEIPAGSVLRSALAGGLACALSTSLLHPVDTIKTRVQASTLTFPEIISKLPQIGVRGLYRGSIPAILGQFSSHGLRTGIFEASKLVLINFAPTLPDIQAAQKFLGRDLEAWETIAVGALSGGLAAVVTTPFDVMKTRMMTAPQGRPISMSMVAFSILRHEGPLGLFKGAVPRFFWIAPLGAMNFAGYELARKAMDKNDELNSDQVLQKKVASTG